MRGGPSTRFRIAGVIAIAIAAGCTHDFGAFTVSDDAATGPTDGAARDGIAQPSDAGPSDVASEAPASCGGAVELGGHCYFAASTQGTFDATRAACAAAGAHLVTIGSAAEQAAIQPISGGQERWIGLARTSDAGVTDAAAFAWITGEPSTFAHWTPGEPNGSGPCVRMKTDGTWADQTCATSLAAICEFE